MGDDLADTLTVLDPGEDEGAIAAHLRAVALHDREVGTDRLGEDHLPRVAPSPTPLPVELATTLLVVFQPWVHERRIASGANGP